MKVKTEFGFKVKVEFEVEFKLKHYPPSTLYAIPSIQII